MNRTQPPLTLAVLAVLAAAAATVVLAGCGSPEAANAPVANAAPAMTTPAPKEAGGTKTDVGTALGAQADADHFAVTLDADPKAPKVGAVAFSAKTLHHGAPTHDAKVHVALSMPAMGMGGPEFDMTPDASGTYRATTKLPMAGAYRATVTITGGEGHSGTAHFDFNVND